MRLKVHFWLALLLLALAPAFAQAQQGGKIHGHTQDPANIPLTNNVQVQLSTDGKTAKYTFPTDQNGDYKGDGIAPGTYVVTLIQGGQPIDRFTDVKITKDADTLQDFDLSRPAYMASLPPDVRKQIEDTKAKNAEAMKANQGISKLNDMLKQARDDEAQKKYDDAATVMQQATALKPDVSLLWLELGAAQVGQKKYSDAVVSLQKAIDLENAAKKPNPETQAAAESDLGAANVALTKVPEANTAYDAAAKFLPASAPSYYTNEAILFSQAGNTDAAVDAANKAIAADPTKPVPYYLKGQALVGKATVDPKTQTVTAPPGCIEAYQKYLELAPTGPYAAEVQQILAGIGVKVNSQYQAPGTTTKGKKQ
jgi:tetratricopeptide (TPR) repeat protein